MIENNVSTDPQNVQTELAKLKWEIEQHKATERRAYGILAFVRTAIGGRDEDRNLTLSNDSREGLAEILHFAGSLLLDATWPGKGGPCFYIYDPDMISCFSQVEYPERVRPE